MKTLLCSLTRMQLMVLTIIAAISIIIVIYLIFGKRIQVKSIVKKDLKNYMAYMLESKYFIREFTLYDVQVEDDLFLYIFRSTILAESNDLYLIQSVLLTDKKVSDILDIKHECVQIIEHGDEN